MSIKRNVGSQTDLSRLTIDISKKIHKRLKAMAALEGKSMRKYISDLIAQDMDKKIPNKETLKAIAAVEEGKELIESKNAQELFDKLGI